MKRYFPSILTALLLFILVLLNYDSSSSSTGLHLQSWGQIPVQHEGRVKPLDSIARSALLTLREKQSFSGEHSSLSPIDWLAKVLMHSSESEQIPVFRIDHPDIIALIQKDPNKGNFFAFEEIEPYLEVLREQAVQIGELESSSRDSYQNALLQLWEKVILYTGLSHTLYVANAETPLEELQLFEEGIKIIVPLWLNDGAEAEIDSRDQALFQWFWDRYQFISRAAHFQILYPLADEDEWQSMGAGLLALISGATKHPATDPLLSMINSYRQEDTLAFNRAVDEYYFVLDEKSPTLPSQVQLESLFNRLQPFYLSILLYIVSFLALMLSGLVQSEFMKRWSFSLLVTAWTIHTLGLICRIVIEQRPPVTNLYSSAIFVGWGAVLLGIILERIYRNGLGGIVSSVLGCLTLIIAHHLSLQGDTMEVMRAVLDSNFWLSTHVVTVTLGYSASFLAGFIATAFILRQCFSPMLDRSASTSAGKMVYGIICFSLFFSFVGTILGGIWADQSWGRFWGWDPKENGALMIVLWNAIIIHARWGGIVKLRGTMLLAIMGNIITSFSWFGVNMLGVGLHSYGFMQEAFFWLVTFMGTQLLFILLGAVALRPKRLNSL